MNSVLYWNAVLLEVSRRDFTRGFVNSQNPGPIGTSRAMAMVHIAIREALALPNQAAKSYYAGSAVMAGVNFPGLPAPADPALAAYQDDVIAGAASGLLNLLYPGSTQYIDDATSFGSPTAFAAGSNIAAAIFKDRRLDGAYFKPPPTPVGSPLPGTPVPIAASQAVNPLYGDHRADPYDAGQSRLGPRWGDVTHFAPQPLPAPPHVPLDPYPGSALQGTPGGYLPDTHYAADYEEVRDFGSVRSPSRSPEQQVIGVFWGYDGANNLGVPPRLYNQIVRGFIKEKFGKPAKPPAPAIPELTREQCADLFAIVNCAMADAGIDAWYYKYVHNLWRPVAGIRNERVVDERDAFWAPLGAPQTNSAVGTKTPPFPAYPSGHATFGAALYQVLRLYFNTAPANAPIKMEEVLKFDKKTPPAPVAKEAMTFRSDELDGRSVDPDGSVRTPLDRSLGSFAQAVWENAISRVYLGVHWRFDGLPETKDPSQRIGGVALGLDNGMNAWNMFKTKLLASPPP